MATMKSTNNEKNNENENYEKNRGETMIENNVNKDNAISTEESVLRQTDENGNFIYNVNTTKERSIVLTNFLKRIPFQGQNNKLMYSYVGVKDVVFISTATQKEINMHCEVNFEVLKNDIGAYELLDKMFTTSLVSLRVSVKSRQFSGQPKTYYNSFEAFTTVKYPN